MNHCVRFSLLVVAALGRLQKPYDGVLRADQKEVHNEIHTNFFKNTVKTSLIMQYLKYNKNRSLVEVIKILFYKVGTWEPKPFSP